MVADGWSLLGTLEFIALWDSPRNAARGARLLLASFALQRRLLRLARPLPVVGSRTARKRRQVDALEEFVVAHARDADGHRCPGAATALRQVQRVK